MGKREEKYTINFTQLGRVITFDRLRIDNAVFRLHYMFTAVILFVGTILVTLLQFLDDPIDCIILGEEEPNPVIDTYCWIHSTFTLPKRITDPSSSEPVAHPGVGAQQYGEETTEHRYYQWVCFLLFLQALLFLVPRIIWQYLEKGRMKKFVPEALLTTVTDARMPAFAKPMALVDAEVVDGKLTYVLDFLRLYNGSKAHTVYLRRFVFCEVLNLVNVVGQIFLVDLFLGGMFSKYGYEVFAMSQADPEDRYDPMNLVFPKMGKCTFLRSGPSGTIETFDALCLLTINIINEKIYVFQWFWFVILATVTGLQLVYRALTVAMPALRRYELHWQVHLLVDPAVTRRVTNSVSVGEWFFLRQLGANLDPHFFARLLIAFDEYLHGGGDARKGSTLGSNRHKSEKIA